ncbi:glycine cleavage system protein GcvH [Mycolicibacterium litorale]|uniref:glycine cleavage system protein GcvH n=1 Tax=Mycolicibacterium litorale TaxID=758802 RepID=UPI001065D989|nr:glycine cleavage system protein GcvH [Mycolicibacterium litorale]MCV7417466.1 glycine cleavage system protein GcvH [Mycolicibacterium litorale]TDY05255.1 glycine cleavage system H protein [Mycolicibacterium litorale]
MTTTELPVDRLYSADHEWVTLTSAEVPVDPVRVGITRVAAEALGDLVFLDLPEVGAEVTAGAACGEVESTKSVSDLVAPVTGTITEINTAAVEDPGLVSADPYGAGWLFTVDVTAVGPLLTAAEYAEANEASS